MTTVHGEPSETHSYTEFVANGLDAYAVVPFPCALYGVNTTQCSKLAVFSISCAEVRNIYCRRCRYQSTSTLTLYGWVSSTSVRRRSQPIVPGFPSPYIDIRQCLFLERTLWLRKERNGKSTERSPLPHSQRYVLSTIHRPILNTLARKTIN